MTKTKCYVIVLLSSIILCNQIDAQSSTANHWVADLEYMDSVLRATHPDPFKYLKEEQYQKQVNSLRERIPTMNEFEIIIGLSELLAGLEDGHTKLQGGLQYLSGYYPVGFIVCEDGIFVDRVDEEYSPVLGHQLIAINGVPADEVYRRAARMTSRDNEYTLKNRVPERFSIPEILQALDIIGDDKSAKFALADNSDESRVIEFTLREFEEKFKWSSLPKKGELPLYLSGDGANYWHKHIEEYNILYVQYNKVRNHETESIKEYFERLTLLAKELKPDGIVLDVRRNGGGNNYFNAPVIEWLKQMHRLCENHTYVIIGRGTFSAAQRLVTMLSKQTNVKFVGEPTGANPNHFGDAGSFPLPFCGMTLRVSTLYHEDDPGNEERFTMPDILVPVYSSSYFNGLDEAMQEIYSDMK